MSLWRDYIVPAAGGYSDGVFDGFFLGFAICGALFGILEWIGVI